MANKIRYPYIDYMRIIAAVLVIEIHIYPLQQISAPADFYLTRVFSRIAVPFFFMVTGFFFFQDVSALKLKRNVVKILKIYLCSICLYLPLTIYNDSFSSLTGIVRALLFNGTMYHLWYLPASILGLFIVYILVQKVSIRVGLGICILLYGVGLGGDSYYQLGQNIPLLKAGYSLLFTIFTYTRNGLFMAPLFLYLGYLLPKMKFSKQGSIRLFVISLVAMSIEAIVLHSYQIPKHDSMYVFLPLTVFFLLAYATTFTGIKRVGDPNLSLYVYLLHPWIIVIVRVISKFLGLQSLLFDTNIIQFLLVTSITFGVSYLVLRLQKGVKVYGKQNKSRLD